MTLDRSDFNTRTWERMEALLLARLDALRKRNDQNLDSEETANLRGRIAEVKSLLALPSADPAKRDPGDDESPRS